MNEHLTYKCNGPVVDGEREGCGRDLTELIESVPKDGEGHDVTCHCGKVVVSVMRTPE